MENVMPKYLKAGESFKLNCTMCGKPAYIDPGTMQVMEDINKVYAIIVCTDKTCGNKSILDGTLPQKDKIILPGDLNL
jgi:hypothetical protein